MSSGAGLLAGESLDDPFRKFSEPLRDHLVSAADGELSAFRTFGRTNSISA